jgi:hypothetical protein
VELQFFISPPAPAVPGVPAPMLKPALIWETGAMPASAVRASATCAAMAASVPA